ncbi:LOW QUALITY PROTEIN: ankyrin repeat domain-containing protein SOWAHC [Electrophorus electricus]|uniref:LOW QUALITY PROTEIN: ankyrin repeat domain-containing protein SOWAHC n=1 Tax=Electrophorus electricus TaxID=8005 RepID=UPI0015D095C2|nr:LOW QUALITY PROTEIN: ankyrin repeat domain-containing protein SOWAHC [Electrophorus electricus]
MATECTQEAVLEFLIEKGGRVKNKVLIDHFKVFFASETTKTLFSEAFGRAVDNVAYIKQENEDKIVCLKKKYREHGRRREKAEDGKTPLAQSSASPHCNASGAVNDQRNGTSFRCSTSGDKRMHVSVSEKEDNGPCVSDVALTEATGSDSDYNRSHDANLKEKEPANVPEKDKPADEIERVETEDTCLRDRPGKLDAARSKRALSAQPAARRRGTRDTSSNAMAGVSDADSSAPLGTDGSAPSGGRKSLAERVVGESPQVRRSLLRRSSQGWATAGRQDSVKGDGDSVSEDSAFIALDPLEHEWMMCASDGEWENLQRLLTREPSLITKKDFVTGFTCLHWAAKQGKCDLIAMLITFAQQHSVAVDVNARSCAGYTPLHLAAMHSHVEVMKLLVEAHGANLEVRDYSGRKPHQYLSTAVAADIRDIIRVHGDEDTEGGAGHWRLPKVFQSNLNPLRMLVLTEEGVGGACEGVGGARPRPLYRKASIGKIKLKGGRSKTQIVHSTSFRETEEEEESLKSPVKSRPVSNLFG